MIDAQIRSKLTENDLNVTKRALELKISFLREEGKQLFDQLAEECSKWDSSSLDKLPIILNIIINERIYTRNPEFLENLVEISWTFRNFYDI